MQRYFRLFTATRTLFTLAVQMQAVVLGWRMYTLTQSTLYLSFVGLTEAVPALGLALLAGYLVDRQQPLKIYRWVLRGSLLSAILFTLAHTSMLHLTLGWQVGLLYAAAFCTGVARAFSQPVVYATLPRLLPRHHLAQAAAQSTAAMQTARVAGPALGGLLLGTLGGWWTAWLIVLLLLLGGALLRGVRLLDLPPTNAPLPTLPFKAAIWQGVHFVFGHAVLLPALALDMLSVFFGGVTALLPVYAQHILHIGPPGLGLLRAAPAVGAVLVGVYLSRVRLGGHAGKLLLWAVAGFGCSIIGFGCSTAWPWSLFWLTLSGMFDSVSVVIRSAAVQLASPAALRGRISAVNAMFIGSSNELGEFESGLAATWLGVVPAVLWGGVFCLLTVAVITWRAPQLRRLTLR